MSKEVIVWGMPNCKNCERTKEWLTENQVPYSVEDLTEPINSDALQHFKSSGLLAAPIVEVYDVLRFDDWPEVVDTWSGYNENKLEEHFA